jgi:probable HAF family extracellular repeat protein
MLTVLVLDGLLLGVALVDASAAEAVKRIRYTLTDLGSETSAVRINSAGEVALTRSAGADEYQAVLFSRGKFYEVEQPEGMMSFARDLNDEGKLVGNFKPLVPDGLSFTWERGLAFIFHAGVTQRVDLDPETALTRAELIDASGAIVGKRDGTSLAVLLRGRDITPLIGPLPEKEGEPRGSFHAKFFLKPGEIVGTVVTMCEVQKIGDTYLHASRSEPYLFKDGRMVKLPGKWSPLGGNRHGVIVGGACEREHGEAVRLGPDGLVRLGIPDGFENSVARAINAAGAIVGEAYSGPIHNQRTHAFLYSEGEWIDLNDAVDLADTAFTELWCATGINDRGQIIGRGLAKGGYHAFLLTPIEGESKK